MVAIIGMSMNTTFIYRIKFLNHSTLFLIYITKSTTFLAGSVKQERKKKKKKTPRKKGDTCLDQ